MMCALPDDRLVVAGGNPIIHMEQKMQTSIGMYAPKRKRLSWWLPSLLGGLALAGSALAEQSQATASVDAEKHPGAARTSYRVINLGAEHPIVAVINASGQVAYSLSTDLSSPVRALFYDGKSIQDIGTLGSDFARVTGLNNGGQIVGVSRIAAGDIHSFIWSRKGGMIDIGMLPGATSTWEPALNKHGVVTGYSTGEPLPYPKAFRWTLASGIEDIGAFPTGDLSISYGRAINDAGLIAGNSLTAGDDHHAFAWTRATGMVDIDTLGNRYSDPVAVGAKGQVAGNFIVPGGDGRAFFWTRATGMQDLGAAGRDGSWMVAMSSGGRIAGVITGPLPAHQRAMTWTQESGMLDLGTLGGHISSAHAANNKGQVVGGAAINDTEVHAYVWTAKEGMIDLNSRLHHPPAGLTLIAGHAISDNGSIVASSNAGLVLLVPGKACGCGHAVGPIAAASLVKVGAAFDASVTFAGDNPGAKHNVIWSWGDGSGDRAGSTSERNGAGSAVGSHTFTKPGVYTVTAKVTDLAGKSVVASRRIVVHDPSSGYAGGAGSFMSPHMPNKTARFQAGTANFSFVAPSMGGASAKNARGELHFNVAGLDFRSKDVRVYDKGSQGQFVGSGTINGLGRHQFSMATTAGGADDKAPGRFSLKIWHTDPATGAEVVDYDSRGAGRGAAESRIVTGKIAL